MWRSESAATAGAPAETGSCSQPLPSGSRLLAAGLFPQCCFPFPVLPSWLAWRGRAQLPLSCPVESRSPAPIRACPRGQPTMRCSWRVGFGRRRGCPTSRSSERRGGEGSAVAAPESQSSGCTCGNPPADAQPEGCDYGAVSELGGTTGRISVSCIRAASWWQFSLTPALSRWERGPRWPRLGERARSEARAGVKRSPSPLEGEGRGEGENARGLVSNESPPRCPARN